jgi:hypothetical protein
MSRNFDLMQEMEGRRPLEWNRSRSGGSSNESVAKPQDFELARNVRRASSIGAFAFEEAVEKGLSE